MTISSNLTLDTSCFISLLKLPGDSTPAEELHALQQIQSWHNEGYLKIWASHKSLRESEQNHDFTIIHDPENRERIEKWVESINFMGEFNLSRPAFVLDISRLDEDAAPVEEHEKQAVNQMAKLLFDLPFEQLKKGDIFDLTILFEHFLQGNDYFITRDRRNKMLKKKAELQQRWGIQVFSPAEIVHLLQQQISSKT